MTEKKGLSRTAKLVLALVALGAMCIPCTGVTAAIAMPAFTRYLRGAQTLEAHAQLIAIRTAIDASGTMPTTLPPTPPLATLGENDRVWPADADPGWAALGYAPLEPLRYSYAVTTDPMLGTVRIEATGDLDADGLRSSLSQLGHITPGPAGSVSIAWDEVIALDAME